MLYGRLEYGTMPFIRRYWHRSWNGGTADMEAGYGNSPKEIERTTMVVIRAGAVGINLEDGTGDPAKPSTVVALQVGKLKAVKQTSAKLDMDFVLNARTDTYLYAGSPTQRFEEALHQAHSYYVSAGADCIFIIGILDEGTISALVNELKCPINAIVVNGNFTVSELRDPGWRGFHSGLVQCVPA
jgi:2-methylisocitrate lyase-like PEP mutase family enzyme